jgi:hypothetical protein
MAGAIIELDLSSPWPDPDVEPAGRGRPVGAALVVLLAVALALTGPALLAPASLGPGWSTDVSTGYFWLTADVVLVVDRDSAGDVDIAGARRPARVRLTAFDLRSGAVRWSLPLTGALAGTYARDDNFLSSNFPPDATTGERTNVIAKGGGLPRLALPAAALPLAYIGQGFVVSIDRDPDVPPDPRANGRTRAMGLEWAHLVSAIDLATGAVRWTARLPAGVRWSLPGVRAGAEGLTGLPSGQDWMVTSSTAGEVRVWDLATGTVRAVRGLGPLKQQSYVTALADLVLVRLDDRDTSTLDAYDPATLTARWTYRPTVSDAEPVACAPLLCLATNRSVWIVDPRSGAVVSRPTGPQVRPGPPGRIVVTGYGNQLTLVDTWRGRPLPGPDDWRVVDVAGYTRMVVVVDAHAVGSTAQLGLLDLATGEVRRLGRISRWTPANRCLAVAGHLACDDGATLRIWRA